jgi:hypothetical protein
MTADEIRARIVAIRAWAIDHEEYEKAHAQEVALWGDVLSAIAGGAERPADLAAAALESRRVSYPRGFA